MKKDNTMEIKAQLNKPYTKEQRIDFIVEQNHQLGYEIVDTEEALEAWGYSDAEIEEMATAQRKAEFEDKFFEVPNYGWYRKKPKGYQSAIESLSIAFNAVSILGSLPANTLIFYTKPDFTKPEECTEEWLVQHQTFNEEMSAQVFGTFYMNFVTAWNNQEHIASLTELPIDETEQANEGEVE